MIPDDLEALALADAIGALDAESVSRSRHASRGSRPTQRAPVASLYDVALALGSSVEQVEPPERVRQASSRQRAPRALQRVQRRSGMEPGRRCPVFSEGAVDGHGARRRHDADPGQRRRRLSVAPAFGARGVLRDSRFGLIDGRVLHAGDFHHADAGSDHGEITTTEGAEVLIVGAIDDYLPGA